MGKKNKSAAEQAAKIIEQESEVGTEGIVGAAEDGTAFEAPADEVTVEKEAVAQKLYTEEEVAEIARQAAASAVAEAMKNAPQAMTQIVQYGAQTDEYPQTSHRLLKIRWKS